MQKPYITFGQAYIIWEPDFGAYKVQWLPNKFNSRNKDIATTIKQIPSGDRRYERLPSENPAFKSNPKFDEHIWWFAPERYDLVKAILALHDFRIVKDITKEQVDAYNQGSRISTPIYDINTFTSRLNSIGSKYAVSFDFKSFPDCNRSYRRLAMMLHPDRNPNNEEIAKEMSLVNEAWSKIKEEKQLKGEW